MPGPRWKNPPQRLPTELTLTKASPLINYPITKPETFLNTTSSQEHEPSQVNKMVFDHRKNTESLHNPIPPITYVPYDGGVTNSVGKRPTLGNPIEDDPEFHTNREERCAVVLVLDTSGSMAGQPIASLNHSVNNFHSTILEDPLVATKVDIAVISFSHVIYWQDFVNSNQFQPPLLQADGGTIISFPLSVALDMVTKRKDTYRLNGISYHRPWILLITDGEPEHDTDHDINDISVRLRQAEDLRQCSLFTITCEEANDPKTFNLLRDKIAPPNRPPKKTTQENFPELFRWLSNSLAAVSQSSPDDRVRLADTSGWEIV